MATVAFNCYVFDKEGVERYGVNGYAGNKANQKLGTRAITMLRYPCMYLENCLVKMSVGEKALFRTDSSVIDAKTTLNMGLKDKTTLYFYIELVDVKNPPQPFQAPPQQP